MLLATPKHLFFQPILRILSRMILMMKRYPSILRSIFHLTAMVCAAGSVALQAAPAGVPPAIKGMDVGGVVHALADDAGIKASAVIFVSTQCPISNKYMPELNRLAKEHANDGIRIYAVISDPTTSRAAAMQYAKEYQIGFPVLFDASGELAQRLAPTMTPEALVLDRAGEVRYRGRIDDLWIDLRKQKSTATTHDLADALTAVAAGKAPATAKTPTIGCYFEAWGAKVAIGKVTYTRDVAPILNANCVQCHRAGEIAPFPLTAYEEAAKHAKQMARVTDEHLMPPWKAEPGFGHFSDERRLSDREVALLAAWVKAGAPEGDAADLPAPPKFTSEWILGEPDVVLAMPQPFEVPASGRDVYRVFSLPMDLPQDRQIIAYQFKPGAATVVHHALLFLDDKHQARKMSEDSKDGLPGYQSFGGIGFAPSGGIGGWAPGVLPYFLPEGVGKPIHAGADAIMQIHYHPDGKAHQDTSKLAIYYAKKPVSQIARSFMLVNREIDIPPGESHYVRTAKVGPLPADVTLLGITPHMHLVGKQMKVIATKPDGQVIPLINVTDWDFRWQDQYRYAEPVKLPKGTVLSMEAVYDNSTSNPDNPNTPPKRVVRGEQTTNEMCICFLQYTVDGAMGGAGGGGGMLRKLFAR
jgi:mono/diheme cytochrome c family protein/thiol-disulfide isomerase/thioredoxin